MRAIILLCLVGLILAAPQQKMGPEGVRAPRAASDVPEGGTILLGNDGDFGPPPDNKPTQDDVPNESIHLLENTDGDFGPPPDNKPTQSSKTA